MKVIGAAVVAASVAFLLLGCSASPSSGAGTGRVQPAAGASPADAMAQLIEAARREGEVNWAITPNFEEGADAFRELVRTKYGVDLRITINSELNYVVKVSKAVSEVQAGIPGTFDLLDISDSSISPLLGHDAALLVDWRRYLPDLPAEAVVENAMLVNYNDFLVPAYNPRLVPPGEAPRGYDDLLDPKWRGKVSSINTMTNWAWLAQEGLWGEEKLKDYVRRLATQTGVRERYAGMLSRLVSGEYPISSGLTSASVIAAQREGQPIEMILAEPMRNGRYGSAVAKNARHPNAAILVALATVSPEAQQLRDKVSASTAAWLPGTPAAKFASEHKTVPIDLDFLLNRQDRIVEELEAIMRGAGRSATKRHVRGRARGRLWLEGTRDERR